MPFDAADLSMIAEGIGGGALRIFTLVTDDSLAAITEDGWLTNAARRGMRVGDLLVIYSIPDETTYTGYVSVISEAGTGTVKLGVTEGRPGIVWEGEWVPGTYAATSAVTHENSLWYAEEATDGEPGVSGWELLVDGSDIEADRIAAQTAATNSAASAAAALTSQIAALASQAAAATSASNAASSATTSSSQAAIATTQAGLAATAKTAAELALSLLLAGVISTLHASIAAGNAATATGFLFAVGQASGNDVAKIYLRTGVGTQTEWNGFPSTSFLTAQLAKLASLSPVAAGFFGKEAFFDVANILAGGARSVFWPRTAVLERLDGEGASQVNIGTDSTEMPGWLKLSASDVNIPYLIYFDRGEGSANKIKIVDAQSALPVASAEIFPLAFVQGTRAWSPYIKFVTLDDVAFANINAKVAVDTGWGVGTDTVLKFPGGRALHKTLGISTLAGDIQRVFEIEFSTSDAAALGASQAQVVWDMGAHARGVTSAAGLLRVIPTQVPPHKEGPLLTLVTKRFDIYTGHGGVRLMGLGVPGGRIQNDLCCGKQTPGLATLFGSTYEVTMADAVATSIWGFTKGLRSTALHSTDGCFCGGEFGYRGRVGTIHVRSNVLLGVDDVALPPQTLIVIFDDGTSQTLDSNVAVEKEHSSGLCTYSYHAKHNFTKTPVRFLVGCHPMAGWTATMTQFGVQGGWSENDGWIVTQDFPEPGATLADRLKGAEVFSLPTTSDLVLPPKTNIFSDRKTPLYASQLVGSYSEGVGAEVTISGFSGQAVPRPIIRSAINHVDIDPAEMTGTVTVSIRRRAQTTDNQVRASTVLSMAPSTVLKNLAFRPFHLGDSIDHISGGVTKFKDRLLAFEALPTFVGTKTCVYNGTAINWGYTPGVTTAKAEAKSGTTLGDWSYVVTDELAPVAPGDETAYLAMPDSHLTLPAKEDFNPLLRASAGGGDPLLAFVRNGYVVDFPNYVTRFGSAWGGGAPTHLFIDLGTNDAALVSNDAAMVAQVESAIAALWGSWHVSYPTKHCFITLHPVGQNLDGATKWAHFALMRRTLIKFVIAQASSYLHCIPGHAMVSSAYGWGRADQAADAYGCITYNAHDEIHYFDLPQDQMAELKCAAVANHPA